MKLNTVNLKHLRIERKMSLKEIADALGFKTPGGYQRIEKGENKLKAEHLPILAQKFEMNVNEFIKEIFFENKLDETSTNDKPAC